MKIIDEPLLSLFRARTCCEHCGRFVPSCQVHHLFGKGQLSHRRFDIAVNLIGLCADCHAAFHYGRIPRERLLELVARRERTTPGAITETIHRLRRQ